MRDEHVPGMIEAALADLRETARLEGAAVIERSEAGPIFLYRAGAADTDILLTAAIMGTASPDVPSFRVLPDGRPILFCPWILPPNRPGGLVLWRAPNAPAWSQRHHAFAVSVSGLVRVMLENSPDESGFDRLTGLPNRLYFLDETDRRIERLTLDQGPGTLIFVSLDNLESLLRAHGRDAAQWAVTVIASLLRAAVRPTDVVARVGRDDFAVWLDGVDHMTAAERAEALSNRRLTLPDSVVPGSVAAPSLSIGIASRTNDGGEDARMLLRRARDAALQVREDGGGGWHVSHSGMNI
ncbi:MAG: GGDEF domain-containing protein [Acetobacteraceae bacterium]